MAADRKSRRAHAILAVAIAIALIAVPFVIYPICAIKMLCFALLW